MPDYPIRTADQLKTALRAVRRAQGLNQSELGREVGLSQERISAIENHPERVTTNQLLTLFIALGVELVLKPRPARPKSAASW